MSTDNGDAQVAVFLGWLQSLDRDELESYRDELQSYTDEDTFRASLSRIALTAVAALLMKHQLRDEVGEHSGGGEEYDIDALCDTALAIQSHRQRLGLEADAAGVLEGVLEVTQRRTKNERDADE